VNKTPSKNNRIWIVSEVFYPEEVATSYIMTEIGLNLANESNYDVHVLCGPESYEKDSNQYDKSYIEKLHIHRINAFNLDKNKAIYRLIRVIGLSLALFFSALFRIKKSDKVFIVTNPATIIPLFSLLKKIKRFKFTILVHDVFPENLVVAKYISAKNILYSVFKKVFDYAYRSADQLIVLGVDMQKLLISKTGLAEDKVRIVQNWADTTNVFPIPFEQNSKIPVDLKSKIIIQYAGNFGPLQNLIEFLEVIKEVKNPELHFVFIGRGAKENDMRAYQKTHKLDQVSFWPAFNRTNQNEYLNACHFGVVSLTDELIGLGVPSKTYNILATAKPVLFIGNSETEIAKTVLEHNCGLAFNYNNKKSLIEFFNNLSKKNLEEYLYLGKNGVHLANTLFSKSNILKKINKLLIDNNNG